jgi:hypothetical protein
MRRLCHSRLQNAKLGAAMSDALSDRVENLAEAIRAQGRVLAMMLGHQKLHNEMLAKVLEAVTQESDGSLAELLTELVTASRDHTEKLTAIFERVHTA